MPEPDPPSAAPPSRWATPQRRWHPPTVDGVVDDVLWTAAFAGALLLGTGDPGRLLVGVGIFLSAFINRQYRTEDEAPVQGGDATEHTEPRSWRRRRLLVRAGLVVLAWCVAAVVVDVLLVRHWPESSVPRTWGTGLALTGAVGWYLHASVPGLRRART